jgi:hypothetical protein
MKYAAKKLGAIEELGGAIRGNAGRRERNAEAQQRNPGGALRASGSGKECLQG